MKGTGMLTLLMMVLLCGCLQESSPQITHDGAPQFDEVLPAAVLMPDQQAAETPIDIVTQKPIAAEPTAPAQPSTPREPVRNPAPAGFTGAAVYVGDNCAPCHWLLTDLQMLQRDHGWRVTEGDPDNSDWVIMRNKPAPAYPTIVFFRDGRQISQSSGYVVSANFSDRRDSLLQLVRTHPKER